MKEITGIVIRVNQFRDNDAMVTVLSNDKIYSFLARGVLKIKSKNASSVNLYNKSRFTLSSTKDGLSLRSGEVISSYENLRTDLDNLAALDFLGEVTNRLVISDDATMAYLWLEACLDALNNAHHDPLTVCLIYLGAILRINGSAPEVNECVICHEKKPIVAMNYNRGGFICRDCASGLHEAKTPVGELQILRYIFKVDIAHITHAIFTIKEAKRILKDLAKFIQKEYDVTLKSIQLLDNLK